MANKFYKAYSPGTKETEVSLLPIAYVYEMYGAMQNGIEIILTDSSRWRTMSCKIMSTSILGTFIKIED